MLEAESLSKSYGRRLILDDIGFQVRPGEITAIIGPSGGGKTTLLRLLAFLEPPDQGVIAVAGQRHVFPSRVPPPAPWPDLTVVFQQLFLWPHLTLRENICLPQRRDPVARALSDHLIEVFSLSEAADKYPNQASLGQRQRAAFIRAVGLRPTYLLLDEVTSALDVEHVALVLAELDRLRAEGMGILLVTHLIGFAAESADQVVFLANGRVGEKGTANILKAPATERLSKFLSLVRAAS
jgi:ABC-type polar amino acid transport system ATPase subunit